MLFFTDAKMLVLSRRVNRRIEARANAAPVSDTPTDPAWVHVSSKITTVDVVVSSGSSTPISGSNTPTSSSPSTFEEDEDFVELTEGEVTDARNKVTNAINGKPLGVNTTPTNGKPLNPNTTPSPSGSTDLILQDLEDISASDFPPHSHLFPSESNGTWRNEALYALKHPLSISVDPNQLYEKLLVLADDASDEVSARLNKAFEGKDVPAMHDKVVGYLPTAKVPTGRDVGKWVEKGLDMGVDIWNWGRGQ